MERDHKFGYPKRELREFVGRFRGEITANSLAIAVLVGVGTATRLVSLGLDHFDINFVATNFVVCSAAVLGANLYIIPLRSCVRKLRRPGI
jgi:hypothetical protein